MRGILSPRDMTFAILCVLFSSSLYSQDIEVFNLDLTEFPVIRANFALTDSNSQPIFNIARQEVELVEEDKSSEVIYFKSPTEFEKPISVLLVFDVSGSMAPKRIEIARRAAKTFVDEMSLLFSEVAILSFNGEAILNTDFTNNYDRLIEAIKSLTPEGGTSYNSSFLTPGVGVFDIARKASFDKYVVFLTDGLSEVNSDTIIQLAKEQDITIYTTTVALPIPDALKEISIQTGGDYFSDIRNQFVGKNIYKQLYREIQSANYGTIKWRATVGCAKEQSTRLIVRGESFKFSYPVPDGYLGKLRAYPDIVVFDSLNKSWPTQVWADDGPLTVTGLRYNKFKVNARNKDFKPVELKPRQLRKVIQIYPPANAQGKYFDHLWIKAGNCDSIALKVTGGNQPQIILQHPVGGEVFRLNQPIDVSWEGISRYKDVDIFLKSKSTDWEFQDKSNNYLYSLNSISDTGLYKVRLRPTSNFDLTEKMRFSSFKDNVRFVKSDPSGTYFMTYEKSGDVSIFSYDSIDKVRSFFSYSTPIIFNSTGEGALLFSNRTVITKNFQNQESVSLNLNATQKLVQTFYTSEGKEMFKPIEIIETVDNRTFIHDPYYDLKLDITVLGSDGDITMNNFGNLIYRYEKGKNLTFYSTRNNEKVRTNRIEKGIEKIFFSADGTKYITRKEKEIKVYDTTGKMLLKTDLETYQYITPDGNRLVTRDMGANMNVYNLSTGRKEFSYNRPVIFKFSGNGNYLFVYLNDQFIIRRIKKDGNRGPGEIKSVYKPYITDIAISADCKFFAIVVDEKVEIYDIRNNNKKISTLKSKDTGFVKVRFRDAENELLTINGDNTISVWSPRVSTKEAESGWFRVSEPHLEVLSPLHFGNQILNTSSEKVFSAFISNKSAFDIPLNGLSIKNDSLSEFEVISRVDSILIPANEQVEVEIRFTPKKIGTRTSEIMVIAGRKDYKSVVVGKGIKRMIEPIVKQVDFGEKWLGERTDTLVPVFKNCDSNVIIVMHKENIGPAKEQFEILTTISDTILPGDTMWASFRYKTQKRGLSMNNIYLMLENMEQSAKVLLTGEGVAPRHVVLYGQVFNDENQHVPAKVTCTDVRTARRFGVDTINEGDYFSFSLKNERSYGLFATSEGYISSSELIDIEGTATVDSIHRNLYLTPLKPGALFRSNLIFFEVDKADLMPSSINELNRLLVFLQNNPGIQIEIHGHTDSDASEEWNLDLSKRRAVSVKEFLIQHGISKERLYTKAFGESKPIAPNTSEQGKQKNRRVEIRIR
ncbi:MAG: OmpA family protein [Bacteroidales bacterium]|nr:OmpA family protein [Bacteroidales bacterium]